MTFSHIMAPCVFCAFPNAKLMAVLRNPVDRMYSHYRMTRSFPKHRIRQKGLSFEQWVQEDMDLMKQAGLYTVDGGKTTTTTTMTTKEYLNSFAGTVEEMKAWERYTNLVQEALLEEKRAKNKTLDFNGIPMPVGRSLYAIHLQIWNLAKKEFGNGGGETEEDNIRQNILAINQEDLKSKRDLEMKKVVRYLNIPNEEFVLDDLPPTDHNSQSYKPMKKETRQWLEEFFEPYNRRLGQLLGPEWDGVWKPKGGVTSEGFA